MKDALIVSALSLLPRKPLARQMGGFARARLSRWMTRAFVTAYGVDLSEATGDLADYPTLEALFTRELKPEARPIATSALVSPVDGTVAAVGRTDDQGNIEVAPGRPLNIPELLGHTDEGSYDALVIYLSPTDYHRVHVPADGDLVDWTYHPGSLWPVFPAAVRKIDGLFSRNERLQVGLQTRQARIECVLVGAFGVGRIEVCCTDLLSNTGAAKEHATLDPVQPVERGDWMGTFHLGSTVVLAAKAGKLDFNVAAGQAVRMGTAIGDSEVRAT